MSDSMNGPKSDPMNDDTTDYQSLIEPYLRQALSEQELAAFEAQLLEDEALLNEVQQAEAMGDELRADPTLLESKTAEPASASWLAGWQQWFAQPQSILASLLLIASLGVPILQTTSNNGLPADAVQTIPANLTLQSLRSSNNSFSAPSVAPILITVDVGPAPAETYRLSIYESNSDNLVLSLDNMLTGSDGLLRFILQEKLSGNYRIEVESANRQFQSDYLVNFTEVSDTPD